MTADRQRICKCGDAIGNFLTDIDFTRDRIKDEKFPPITDFILRDPVYGNIRNIAESCGIDTRRSESLYDNILRGMSKMKGAKNDGEFYEGRGQALTDLCVLMSEIRNKVRECSR